MKKIILIVVIALLSVSATAQMSQQFTKYEKTVNDSIVSKGEKISFFYGAKDGKTQLANIAGVATFNVIEVLHHSWDLIMVKLHDGSILRVIFSTETGEISSVVWTYQDKEGIQTTLRLHNFKDEDE